MIIIGIDPGKRGAVAVIDTATNDLIDLQDTPMCRKDYDILAMNDILSGFEGNRKTYIEKQRSWRHDSGPAAFTTGRGYGIWLTLLTTQKIPFETVEPKTWQKKMGIAKNCYGSTKKASLKLAAAYFPKMNLGVKNDKDGRSDATLIAIYGAMLEAKHKKGEYHDS